MSILATVTAFGNDTEITQGIIQRLLLGPSGQFTFTLTAASLVSNVLSLSSVNCPEQPKQLEVAKAILSSFSS